MTSTLFIEEVIKTIDNKNLIERVKDYINKENVLCKQLEVVIQQDPELKKYEPLLLEAHKLFVFSQEMLDNLACKDLTPFEGRDMDIVMCYTFYAGVCVILRKYLPDDLYERIIDIYEEANIKLNVPRNDEEENEIFFTILREFFTKFYIPVKLSGAEVHLTEYDYGVLYYEKMLPTENVPDFLLKKKRNLVVDGKMENEILTMCF